MAAMPVEGGGNEAPVYRMQSLRFPDVCVKLRDWRPAHPERNRPLSVPRTRPKAVWRRGSPTLAEEFAPRSGGLASHQVCWGHNTRLYGRRETLPRTGLVARLVPP